MPTGKYGDYRIIPNTQVKDADGKAILWQEEIFFTLKGGGENHDAMEMFKLWVYIWGGYRSGTMSLLQADLHVQRCDLLHSGLRRARESRSEAGWEKG